MQKLRSLDDGCNSRVGRVGGGWDADAHTFDAATAAEVAAAAYEEAASAAAVSTQVHR